MNLTIKATVSGFISKLFTLRIQAHIFHLQTKNKGSFAQHSALDTLYKDIVDLTDELIESYQGTYDIIKGYKLEEVEDYENVNQVITYLTKLLKYIDTNRISLFPDSDLLNLIDEIKTLIRTTLYKLKNLE